MAARDTEIPNNVITLPKETVHAYRIIQREMAAAEIAMKTAQAHVQGFLLDLEVEYDIVIGRDAVDLDKFCITKA